jgi:hypothetical protein
VEEEVARRCPDSEKSSPSSNLSLYSTSSSHAPVLSWLGRVDCVGQRRVEAIAAVQRARRCTPPRPLPVLSRAHQTRRASA